MFSSYSLYRIVTVLYVKKWNNFHYSGHDPHVEKCLMLFHFHIWVPYVKGALLKGLGPLSEGFLPSCSHL